METGYPAVVVAVSPRGSDPVLVREVVLGLEEESVPSRVVELEGTAEEMGHQAALLSPLGVGVAVGSDGWVVVHQRRLRQGNPLFRVPGRSSPPSMVRDAGCNAARLVKGVPLRLAPEMSRAGAGGSGGQWREKR